MRNRLTLFYAVVLPLLPLGLLFLGERGDVDAGVANVSTVLLMALMFPVYYNLLSMFVTRRDELVLKRLRTGEVRDARDPGLDGAARARRSPLVVTLIDRAARDGRRAAVPGQPGPAPGRGAARVRRLRRARRCGRPPGRATPRPRS